MGTVTAQVTEHGGGPLHGLRVIDCSTILAGPLVCQILGDFGADVVKVEHPEHPDGLRGHGDIVDGQGVWWKEVGRNKRTVAINLADPDGAALLLDLARTADVLVENFRPGTFERWGLGPDVLHEANPGLVVLRVTGFGQEGPYASRPAFGTLVEAMSGFAHLTGQPDGPPTLPAFGLADSIAGMAGVAAVMMALYHRDASRTGVGAGTGEGASGAGGAVEVPAGRGAGRGQIVDLSLLEPIMTAVGPSPTVYDLLGVVHQRQGNRSSNNAPRNLYETSDGHWLAISTSAGSIARRVLELVGHPEVIDEPWFETGAGRAQHADLLDGYVASWIGARTRDEVMEAMTAAGAAVAPVFSAADLVADPQVQARPMLTRVPDEDFGELLQHNVLFQMSDTPGGIRATGRAHGADTDEVLAGLGVPAERIEELRGRRVVR